MKAVVMAGGEGSRLRPLTLRRPKPMVPVVDKPVISHILELLKQHGIDEVVVTLQYMAENIQEYFGDGSSLGMTIHYSIEETPLGTAGSVKQAEEWLDDTFLLISGDALCDFDLTRAIEYHREKGSMATLVLKRMPNPLEYGVVIIDDEGRIKQFQEKPSWGEVFSDTVNTGIYVLDPKILGYFEAGKVFDFSMNLFPMMLKKGDPMFGYVADGYWCDIGSLPDYMRATGDLLEGQVQVPRAGKQVMPGVWAEEDVEIDPTAILKGPIYLSSGVKIKEGVTIQGPSVIRDYTVVDSRAIVDRSIIWRNCYIGERVEVHGAILARQVSIKSRAMVFEGTVIGDNTTAGEGSMIQPGVKVWPDKEIEAGATLATSLIWGAHSRRNLFGRFGVTGVVNVDLTPEFTAKLGAAYGATLKRGGMVTVNRDAHYITRMLKRAVISGLPSAGMHVADMGSVPIPVTRYWTRISDAEGGMHLRLSPVDTRVVDIRFFDSAGLELNKNTERKIETTYFREDFRRVFLDEIGRIFYPSGVAERYADDFLQHIDVAAVQGGSPYNRIVVDYAGGSTAQILPPLLGQLGCDVVAINAAVEETSLVQTPEQFEAGMARLSAITKSVQAGFGVRLDTGGERIYLVDDKGRILSGMDALAAVAALYVSLYPGSTIAVPVYAPSSMDTIAERANGTLLRTQGNPSALSQAANRDGVSFAGQGNGSFAVPAFHPAPDGMFAIAKLVELTARLQTKLSAVVEDLPRYAMLRKDVSCRWEDKGKVMRLLNERYRDNNIPQIDGVKIMENGNEWVLILPDADQPTFHIIAEARNDDRASAMVEKYTSLVSSLQA
ncbi:MAG TPA: mannose-1-phosphate guanyltransferase [Chloroflexia bacterium]|nr:mannose-1-phosphate guanyltransferase [Chloroflexia bacterium]